MCMGLNSSTMGLLPCDWRCAEAKEENETLKTKLLLMEGELRAVRGYGEETQDNSLNISFEVQVCDEFGEAQRRECLVYNFQFPDEKYLSDWVS